MMGVIQVLPFLLLLISSNFASSSAIPASDAKSDIVPGSFMVEFEGNCGGRCRELLEIALVSSSVTRGCSVHPDGGPLGSLSFENVQCPSSQNVDESDILDFLLSLKDSVLPNIVAVEQDSYVTLEAVPTSSWSIDEADGGVRRSAGGPVRDGLRTCTANSNLGEGVNIWFFDSGCDPLNGGFCFPTDACADTLPHGTFTSAVATDPENGLAPRASRSCVKICGENEQAAISIIISRLQQIVNDNLFASRGDVINMSFTGEFSQCLNNAIEEASRAGIYFTLAAGNQGSNACERSPPSASGSRIFVAQAHDINLRAAGFTNFGTSSEDCTDLSGPGVNVPVLGRSLPGTSLAAPHVAGAIALLLSDGKGTVTLSDLTSGGVFIFRNGALAKRSVGLGC